MKKIIFIILAVIASIAFAWFIQSNQELTVTNINEPELVAKQEMIGVPQKLIIPSLSIDAKIIGLGMDSQGRMDVPTNPDDVGWYNQGYRVGQNGTAVLTGHLDQQNGTQAVFWELNKIAVGDIIQVVDDQNKEYEFKVVDKQIYKHDQLPLEYIFNTYGESRLNIITCQGNFVNGNYSDRLVIYGLAT